MSLFPLPGPAAGPSLPEPAGPRWQILRAGLQNVWEYDDQRFVFHRGRLLLRGRNESGKTKALELLFPFLLDADLSPQRLDPFGSTSRPMRWNLINEHNPEVSISIGYVWLELGRVAGATAETYTIGAGLRAKRQTPGVEVWYFTTSQRVDRDLHLLDGGRVPLTRAALQEAIGPAGRVFEAKADYRRSVNQRLFGMSDDHYAALIEALLQLRRPQLSKQLEPEQLSEILTASLPPLDARAVAPLAEGFERLDRHRAEREELQAVLGELRSFASVYRTYAATVAKARARELTRADSAHQRARGELRSAQEEEEGVRTRVVQLVSTIERLAHEEEALSERLQALRSSDEYRAVEQLDRAEAEAASCSRRAERALEALSRERSQLEAEQDRLTRAEAALAAQAQLVEERRQVAGSAAGDADLADAHQAIDVQVEANDAAAARGILDSVLARRADGIRALSGHQRKVADALQAERAADERRREAEARAGDAEAGLASAEQAEAAAGERLLAQVAAWADSLQVLRLEPSARAAMMSGPLDEMPGRAGRLADEAAVRLEAEAAGLAVALREAHQKIDVVREERDGLAAATHQPPSPPPWRPPRAGGRAGAPLYLLCDFATDDERVQASLEAALESSGLLDAWVLPEGVVLEPGTDDVLLRPEPREGATLADVLEAAEDGSVARAAIERILRTVALVREDEPEPEAGPWISTGGRWSIGPLHGSWRKERASFVGAAARERERARRLADLEGVLGGLERDHARLEASLASLGSERARLAEERRRFPPLDELRQARAEVATAARRLATERGVAQRAAESRARAEAERKAVVAARDAAAAEWRLAPWLERIDELRERSDAYRAAARDLLEEARHRTLQAARCEEWRTAAGQAAARSERAQIEADAAASEERRAEARAVALREAVGATRDTLLAALREAEVRRSAVRGELEKARTARSEADRSAGLVRGQVESAERDVASTDERRRRAFADFEGLAQRGLLAFVDLEPDARDASAEDAAGLPRAEAGEAGSGRAPDRRSFTDALLLARRIDAATPELDGSSEAQEKAENRVSERQQDLTRRLPQEMRLLPERAEGMLAYRVVWNARSHPLQSLLDELAADLQARDRLLGKEEAELFETFLSGETHERLRASLREAHQLVSGMNEQLAQHPSSSGMRMRLRWEVAEGAPAGAREAIALMFKAGHLLSDSDRGALRDFLQQRLSEARDTDGAGSLQERMLSVLDYRRWFAFEVEFQPAGEGWKRLTRKAHGAGSGGQKAVLLHLPLFAAAAAFYSSASPVAPRLIVLDEAFAGIDRESRAQLMGLLSEFGLDFIMTSYEEWGFYAELDGLSTYYLSREKGMRGVHTDWFLWDGKRAVPMETGPGPA